MGAPGKRVYSQGYRGFESHPVRHYLRDEMEGFDIWARSPTEQGDSWSLCFIRSPHISALWVGFDPHSLRLIQVEGPNLRSLRY